MFYNHETLWNVIIVFYAELSLYAACSQQTNVHNARYNALTHVIQFVHISFKKYNFMLIFTLVLTSWFFCKCD